MINDQSVRILNRSNFINSISTRSSKKSSSSSSSSSSIINNSNNNNNNNTNRTKRTESNDNRISIETLKAEALGQLSTTATETKKPLLLLMNNGKKVGGFLSVPSNEQVKSQSFVAEYCRTIDHGRQIIYSCGGIILALSLLKVKNVLDTPSRTYVEGANTVGNEYDAWTKEEILEYYWGEHIHLGYYRDEDLAKGARTLLGHKVKDFIEAKEDFVDEMFKFSKAEKSDIKTVLDVGCGIGGASRRLASSCIGSGAKITGITLSQEQAKRANELAKNQNIPNANFQVMDALNMSFDDNSFDLVWACESGEHMPDKKKYVDEMMRVLKPGGTLVLATWCQRETPPALTKDEQSRLQFLYDEWAHPYFISIEEYGRLVERANPGANVALDDWTKQTIVSWRHSIWAGVYDPLPVFTRPKIWYKTLRDIICLERMQRAFKRKLMVYGMMRVVKK
jgi:MPBQ/MSBQ methyltransferase